SRQGQREWRRDRARTSAGSVRHTFDDDAALRIEAAKQTIWCRFGVHWRWTGNRINRGGFIGNGNREGGSVGLRVDGVGYRAGCGDGRLFDGRTGSRRRVSEKGHGVDRQVAGEVCREGNDHGGPADTDAWKVKRNYDLR